VSSYFFKVVITVTLNLNLAVSQLEKVFETAELKLFSETMDISSLFIETEPEADALCCSNFVQASLPSPSSSSSLKIFQRLCYGIVVELPSDHPSALLRHS
jgi:hypothetical protein